MEITYLPVEEITPFIPFTTSPFFIEDYYGNRLLYPQVLPETEEYRLLDQAILRATLKRGLADAMGNQAEEKKDVKQPVGVIAIPGLVTVSDQGITIEPSLFTYARDIREAVLIVLDGLAPSSTQVLRKEKEQDTYVCFSLCLEGENTTQKPFEETLKISFASGDIREIPLQSDDIYWLMATPGEEAIVEYDLAHTSILGNKSGSISVVFGEVGMVVDTRGRPFALPEANPFGRERMKKWLSSTKRVMLLK